MIFVHYFQQVFDNDNHITDVQQGNKLYSSCLHIQVRCDVQSEEEAGEAVPCMLSWKINE